MLKEFSSTSTGIGFAPTILTASQVAIYVCAGTITSSPFDIPHAFKTKVNASKPLLTPIQFLAEQNSAYSVSNDSNS